MPIQLNIFTGELENIPSTGGGGGGAPTTASYVVLSNDPALTNERALAVTDGLSLVDAGANSSVTIRNTLARVLLFSGA